MRILYSLYRKRKSEFAFLILIEVNTRPQLMYYFFKWTLCGPINKIFLVVFVTNLCVHIENIKYILYCAIKKSAGLAMIEINLRPLALLYIISYLLKFSTHFPLNCLKIDRFAANAI